MIRGGNDCQMSARPTVDQINLDRYATCSTVVSFLNSGCTNIKVNADLCIISRQYFNKLQRIK